MWLIILVAGLVVWLVNPQVLTNMSAKISEKLQFEAKKKSKSVLGSAIVKVNTYINDTTKKVLKDSVGIELEQKVNAEIINNVPDNSLDNIILIDYLTSKNLKLEFELNKTYYLDLRNVPNEYCLFINKVKYELKPSQYLKVLFNTVGTYNLAFEKCVDLDTKFGEIVVE